MDIAAAIPLIEREWELEVGFFGRLHAGVFDTASLERVAKLLESIVIDDTPMIDRRFVALTWYIPQFMRWQREGIEQRQLRIDVRQLELAENRLSGLLDRILGVP